LTFEVFTRGYLR